MSSSEIFFDARSIYRTEHAFAARANAYHDFMAFNDESNEILARLERELGTPDRIIDIGCGIGDSLLPVGPQVLKDDRVIGLDISPATIRALREKLTTRGWSRLLCADICHLPLRDHCADLAMARHMLYHVSDLARALTEVGRVLRPGGSFLATTNSVHGKAELFDLHRRALAGVPTGRLVARGSGNFSAEEGRAVLLAAFHDVREYRWRGCFRFPNEEAGLRYYVNTVYFRKAFNDARRRRRLEDAARRLIHQIVSKHGSFVVSNSGAAFLARSWRGAR